MKHQCEKAFTLAEVLITLGIIGVVAALTIPTLIANYKKNEAITRIKRTYSVLGNVLERAKADYGDPNYWTFEAVGSDYDSNKEAGRSAIKTAMKKYVLPYLADGYEYQNDTVSLQNLGYKTAWKYYNGTVLWNNTTNILPLRLNDGTLMSINPMLGLRSNEDGSTTKILLGLMFYFDINGPKAPNIMGKDIFCLCIPFTPNSKLFFYQNFIVKNGGLGDIELNSTEEELKQNCETKGTHCAALIQSEGWQINYKY